MKHLIHLLVIMAIFSTQCMVEAQDQAPVHVHADWERDAHDFVTSRMEFDNRHSATGVLKKRHHNVQASIVFDTKFVPPIQDMGCSLLEAMKNSSQYGNSWLKFFVSKEGKEEQVMVTNGDLLSVLPDSLVYDLLKQAYIILRLESESTEHVSPIVNVLDDPESGWGLRDEGIFYRQTPEQKHYIFQCNPGRRIAPRVIRELYQWLVRNHYRINAGG